MLVIEVQLPQQEERKKIEWNKNGDPTFAELKDRIQHCGVPDDWCVEVLRGTNFVSPDLNTHIQGPKITVRASPVLGLSSLTSLTLALLVPPKSSPTTLISCFLCISSNLSQF